MTRHPARIVTLVASALLVLFASPLEAGGSRNKERSVVDLGDGVRVIRHPDAPDGFPQGNTMVVIGSRDVLVVDSCLLPSSARQDIEEIRRWTTKPVTYLVNTHWHFDHTLGNRTYAEAFPGLRIVAHAATRKIIADNNPGAMARYPARTERFRTIMASGKNPDGTVITPKDREDYEEAIAGNAVVVKEFNSTTQTVPTIGFRDRLDLDLGGRSVELRWLGPGNTAGDVVVFLPAEGIVASGDLVVHPVPYLFGGFPVDFVATLRTLTGLGARVIVPGHGAIQRDTSYIALLIELMEAVNREIEKEVNDGKTLEEAQASAGAAVGVDGWRKRFAGDDEEDGAFFTSTFNGLIKASYNQIKMR